MQVKRGGVVTGMRRGKHWSHRERRKEKGAKFHRDNRLRKYRRLSKRHGAAFLRENEGSWLGFFTRLDHKVLLNHVVRQVLDIAAGHDRASIHDRKAVGKFLCELQILFDEKDTHFTFLT